MKKNNICLALMLSWIMGFTATPVQARGGGGHREAPRSGGSERFENNARAGGEGQRGEIKTNSNSRTGRQPIRPNVRARLKKRPRKFRPTTRPQNKPFSSGWYASHPQAWQANRIRLQAIGPLPV